MKIFSILIVIINIESSDKRTENAHLEENLSVLLKKLKENQAKTSAVLPFEKLKEQLIRNTSSLQKTIVLKTEIDNNPGTIVNELVDKLNYSKAIFEEPVIEDIIDHNELQKLSDELKKELKELLNIFKKVFGEKSNEHEGIKNFRIEFIKQHEDLINFLDKPLSEDFDLSEEKNFEEEVKERLIRLEKKLNTHLNREDLVHSELAVFLKELDENLDRLIKILKETCDGERQDNSNILAYELKIQRELTSLCEFLHKSLNFDLKAQSESIKSQPNLYEKLASLVSFLTDHTLHKSAALTVDGVNPTPLGENSKVDSVTSMQISHKNTQTPLVLTASVPAQIPRSEDKIISINPPNNILLTEKKGSTHELGLENQNHDEINIQENLSTKDIEESKKDPDQQNSPKTHHSDTNPTFLNLIRKTSIASPVLEPEDQLGLTTSPKKLSIDNLSTAMQDPKLELKPGKNLQDNNMTIYKESFEEGDPKGLSINTKDETKLESQQSVNSNKIQGVDPKISEALNLSNDEQFILQHENSNKTIQGDDPKISEALNLFNDKQFILQNENSILSNTNKDQNKENLSQISKDNVKKELEKTNEDSSHNNGLAIEKDELKNNKASEVEKKSEKMVEDVDIPEKSKTEPRITKDFKTELPKKNYDKLKKFANNHSEKKKYSKGVQQKTVSDNDSKTLHSKKDKQSEDSSPKEVLNNHKKSISEDAHDNSTIIRVNGNVSAVEKKQLEDDGKPQNSVQKNDFMSFKAKPVLNEIIPIINLNFTIRRRLLWY